MHTNKKKTVMQGGGYVFLVIITSLQYATSTWMGIMQCTYILSDSLIRYVIYVVCLLFQKSTKWQLRTLTYKLSIYILVLLMCGLQRRFWLFIFESHMWHNWGPLPKDLADSWHVIWKLYFVAEVAVYWIVYSNKFCADFFSWLTIDTNKIAIQLASFHYNFRENLIRTKVKRIART